MKLKLTFAAVVAVSSGSVSAQPADPQAALTSSGQGQYEVWCKVIPMSGEETTRYLQPGRDTLALNKVRRADCSYKSSAAGQLTLTLVGAEWSCPFSKNTDTTCAVSYAASAFGSFELRRKIR